ncbi:unnamed protein product [Adineta steineri]|uniref:Uncharacterized protein n=1 Tax=Adineta steineri TaxID=433720 RepID=A0A818JGJ2_9BILA|nr:unnamed protein product [Adineta steineri]
MNENEDKTQMPQSPTLEALHDLENHSSTPDSNEPQQMEIYADELTTNIIKDASKTASENHDENLDNTNELHFSYLQTSKQSTSEDTTTISDQFNQSTTNNNNNFDDEDIQKKMNDVIQDIRSLSGDDTINIPHKSITSNHLHHEETNNSMPTIDPSTQIDPVSNNQTEGPVRSLSESALVDHHTLIEQPLPIRQDESLSDIDDTYEIQSIPTNIPTHTNEHPSEQENHINNPLESNHELLNTETGTTDSNQDSSNIIKPNNLDETARFHTTSPTNKHLFHNTLDEPLTSGDEGHTQIDPTNLPDDINQEIASSAQSSLHDISSLNRPRSPTPNNSRKSSTHSQINDKEDTKSLISNNNTTDSPVFSDHNQQDEQQQQNENIQSSIEINASISQQESIHKNVEQQTSRSSSTPANGFTSADDQPKRIKSGIQLLIPTHDFNNERINSPPPPLSAGIKSMVLFNPLLSHINEKEQGRSRSTSEASRKMSTTSSISNEKIIDEDSILSNNQRESNHSQQSLNIADEKSISQHGSQTIEQTSQKSNSRRTSDSEQQQQQDESNDSQEQQAANGRDSKISQESTNYRESSVFEQPVSSRRDSENIEHKSSSRKGSITSEKKLLSNEGNFTSQQELPSRHDSISSEQKIASRKNSANSEQKASSKQESFVVEEQVCSRRESQSTEQQLPDHQQSSSDQQERNLSSQPVSRKTSPADQQQQVLSRPTSITRENQLSSPDYSNFVKISSPQVSSRRNSPVKEETQSNPITIDDDSHHLVLNGNEKNQQLIKHESDSSNQEIRTSDKHKQERISSTEKNSKHQSSFQRHSGRQSREKSTSNTDETVIIPIALNSSKNQQHNGKRISTTDSDLEHKSTSKLPPVNSSSQHGKLYRSARLNKQQVPVANRSETKHISSSHSTTSSGEERSKRWIKNMITPSVDLTDGESQLSCNKQSEKVEHNQTTKKRHIADEQQRPSHRSFSANSSTHIRLVDDRSLDSTSDNNTDRSQHNRRNVKAKKKDIQTNTDQIIDSRQQQQQQNSSSDEQKLTPKKPLKATKPMSDHFHSTHQRTSNKEQLFTTSDQDKSTIRCKVKQSNDSNQDKDPVNVNITVVVRKTPADESSPETTAEDSIEQKPKQYFTPIQHSAKKNKQKSIEHHDRETQSDTEQIITEKQKTYRQPKRISRTCQTYEYVFRRMERDRYQELRATSETEKNIQTRKSQLSPRRKLPRKYLSPYLSTDALRIEEMLRKQFYPSRRNLSKSASLTRSMSPQTGKLLILRPTLPFHHTDAVSVQRVCLQYAIDLVPHNRIGTHRSKSTIIKQSEEKNNVPIINASSPSANISTNKTISNKHGEHKNQRRNNGTT